MNVSKLCALSQGWTVRWNYRFSYRRQSRLTGQPKVPFWVNRLGYERGRVRDYNPEFIATEFVELLANSDIKVSTESITDPKLFKKTICAIIARRHLEWQQSQQGAESLCQDGIEF